MKKTPTVGKNRTIKWGRDVTSRLYKAVFDYVKAHDGIAVVMGGVALVHEDGREFNYGVMVRVTGRPPQFPSKR